MSIRKPAALRYVRQLLELPLSRMEPLSEDFLERQAEFLIAVVALDEQHARTEALIERLNKGGN